MNDFLNVEDLSDEDIDAILGLGTSEEKKAMLEQQLSMANQLRNAQGPEGRSYAGIYTAANPLEHAAYAWKGIKAGKDAERITQEQQAILQQDVEARKKFFNAMMRQKQLQQGSQQGYGPEAFENPGVY